MQCYRIVNGIKNKNIKNSLGATWNASHLAEGHAFGMLGDALIIFCLHRNMPKACPYVLIRKFSPRASQFQIIDNQYSIKIVGGREVSRPYRNVGFGMFDAAFFQEIMLSSGVFRRETASGFYPFGDATDLVRGRR